MTFTLAIHYTIGAVLYPFFVYIFFGMVLSPRKLKGPYWLYAVLGVLCLQPFCTARCLLDESSFFFQLMAWIQLACIFGYLFFMFREKLWVKVLMTLLWMLTAVVSELILAAVIGDKIQELDFTGDDPEAIIYELVLYLITCSVLCLSGVFWKWIKEKHIPKNIWIFLLFPVSQYLMIHNFPMDIYTGKVGYEYPWQTVFSLFLGIVADVILFYVMFTQGEKEKIKQQLAETEKLMELEKGYYETIELHREETAKIRHDFNNQLTAALHIAKNGEGEKSVELLEQLREEIEKNSGYRWCENAVINAVLSDKYRLCEKDGIKFTAEITVASDMGIQPLHMCSVLANLLDNAIRAAAESGMADAFVTVHVKQQERYLFVKAENTATEQGKKEKRPGHGYGVQIVTGIAKQYNGEYKGSFEKGVYTAMVVLEIKK